LTAPFEKPERSCFNLTHFCRLIPESHCMFVMPPGCSRILRLSAIEEGISQNFTVFALDEKDVINGEVESILIDGAVSTIEDLSDENRRPRIFMLFVSCIDGFIGTDHDYVMSKLKEYAPDIHFLDLAVDPINRATKPPLVRFHNEVTDLFIPSEKHRSVIWLGSYAPPAEDAHLRRKLDEAGIKSLHLIDSRNFDELTSMGGCIAALAATPMALPAVKRLKERLGIPYRNLCDTGDPDSLSEEELLKL